MWQPISSWQHSWLFCKAVCRVNLTFFKLHVQTSLALITVMCSVTWATLKTYFHIFLLVRVSAGSETRHHLITLILIYVLQLMAAVWENTKKKRDLYIRIFFFCCACLMFVDNCVTMCHDLLHAAGETALRSTLFFTNTFYNDGYLRLRLWVLVVWRKL